MEVKTNAASTPHRDYVWAVATGCGIICSGVQREKRWGLFNIRSPQIQYTQIAQNPGGKKAGDGWLFE